MSLATRHMTDKLTYWTHEEQADPNDIYGGGAWSDPATMICEYESGGSMQRDDKGVEFQPSSSYYTVLPVPYGALVVEGESLEAEPPKHAERVRKVETGTALRGQMKEYAIYTG